MRIAEVIGPYINQERPAKPSLPSQSRLDITRQNQSLLALLYQALMRDGRVIAPGMIASDFQRGEERSEEDDDWLSGGVAPMNGIAGE